MPDRPYTLLSCAVSIDGYLDDATGDRLILSNAADLDRVDEVRAGVDAILVGAETVRRDNPRLLVRSAVRREARVARGLPPSPAKVTVTARGDLDPSAAFFTAGTADRIVYCATSIVDDVRERLGKRADAADAGEPVDLSRVAADLAGRGVGRLMVEGGARVLTGFLTAGLADELHLVTAPFFVGDSRAPRFVHDGVFPWTAGRRARVVEVRPVDDVVLVRYGLTERCTG